MVAVKLLYVTRRLSAAAGVLAITVLSSGIAAPSLAGAATITAKPRTSHPSPKASKIAPLPAVPGLSITVTDGRTRVSAGDRVTYVVRVGDSGTVGVRRLKITLTLPAALTVLSASRQGQARAGQVTWHAQLLAGHSLRYAATARLGKAPAGQARLAAVACALAAAGKPVVCAAHLDRLPAVAAARPDPRPRRNSGSPLVYAAAGVLVLIVVAVALTAGRVRARRRPRGVRRLSA
jgi:uncharacterized repeat protein (TIGR01451 family)